MRAIRRAVHRRTKALPPFYEGIRVPDLPLVQGMFIFFAAAVILANLVADLLYPFLDPRVRP